MPDERETDRAGLAWQTEIWNRMSQIYERETDQRFAPVVELNSASARLPAANCSRACKRYSGRSMLPTTSAR
jgi:hypothetical protein